MTDSTPLTDLSETEIKDLDLTSLRPTEFHALDISAFTADQVAELDVGLVMAHPDLEDKETWQRTVYRCEDCSVTTVAFTPTAESDPRASCVHCSSATMAVINERINVGSPTFRDDVALHTTDPAHAHLACSDEHCSREVVFETPVQLAICYCQSHRYRESIMEVV